MRRLGRLACLVAGSLLVLRFVGTAPRRLDEKTALYFEDAAIPRPVAHVRASVLVTSERPHLVLDISALGDGVDALPGLEGVPGANLRTAEELDRLLREQSLQLVMRCAGISVPGSLVDVRRERLPARRLLADGRLELQTTTAAVLPVCVTFASSALPAGTSWHYLQANGVPRLAVQVDTTAGTARIVAIDSLREPAPAVRSAEPAR